MPALLYQTSKILQQEMSFLLILKEGLVLYLPTHRTNKSNPYRIYLYLVSDIHKGSYKPYSDSYP